MYIICTENMQMPQIFLWRMLPSELTETTMGATGRSTPKALTQDLNLLKAQHVVILHLSLSHTFSLQNQVDH